MAQEDFVSVAADDWYQRRRQDAEGEFFRSVANQGPRKGTGGSTRQGIYILSAAGRLLAYRNHQDPDVMRTVLRDGLAAWQRLPAAERAPGAVVVGPPAKVDRAFVRTPPPGGLIVDVNTRILDRDAKGELCRGSCESTGGDQAARDHLWITADECQALLPPGLREGDSIPVPARLALRMLRFHLVDNTRGEPQAWSIDEVRSHTLKLTIEKTGPDGVRLRLDGGALLATAADPKRAERGFDVRLLGYLHYDANKKVFTRFDAVAVGAHWGETSLTSGARPGRTPLGVAFRLASGDNPADFVAPQGSRWMQGYIRAEHE